MSRPTPRRSSSRAATPRPRKIAGGRTPADTRPVRSTSPRSTPDTEEPGLEEPEEQPAADDGAAEHGPDEPGRTRMRTVPRPSDGDSALQQPQGHPVPADPGRGAGRGARAAEAVWCVSATSLRDEPRSRPKASEGSIAVPEDRPVLPTELAWQEGVEAAAKAAADDRHAGPIRTTTRRSTRRPALMTAGLRRGVPRRPPTTCARSSSRARPRSRSGWSRQGVVRANDTELQALVFLDHYVIRDEGQGRRDDAHALPGAAHHGEHRRRMAGRRPRDQVMGGRLVTASESGRLEHVPVSRLCRQRRFG